MPSATRAPRHPPLRATLERLLALSFAAAACHTTTETSSPAPIDATSDAPTDASQDAAAVIDASVDASSELDAPVEDSACAPVRIEAGFFGEDGSCANFVYLPCGHAMPLPDAGCVPVSIDLCVAACPLEFFTICTFPAPTCVGGYVDPDAAIYLDCSTCLGNIGRRPAGMISPRRGGGPALGEYFALAAYLERASVEAFVQLRARLVSFGAPARLARGALRAAVDERRHARMTARLARRFGTEVDAVRPSAELTLTFEDFALENAVEGCVRETFGALVSMHQRERAHDRGIARAMGRVAEDETRHAELAWAIHRWAAPQLAPAARRRIRRAQERALAELAASGEGGWATEVIREAGMPDRAAQTRLVEAFGRTLFGAESDRRATSGRARQRSALNGRNPAAFAIAR
jgi:hypothetical protein